MADIRLLRLSATLLFMGILADFGLIFLHPAGANDHQTAFAAYAASGDWTAVHLAQFAGWAVLLAGLLVLFFAFDAWHGPARWIGFFGAVAAGMALALAGVVYALGGVALKQAVDAWARAPAAEQAVRFANAETLRWLEWGTRSYLDFMLGLAVALPAVGVVWTARGLRPVGYLLGLSGLAYLVLGWVLGVQGFAPAGEGPSDLAQVCLLVASLWLLVVAWRKRESVQVALPADLPHQEVAVQR